MKKNLKRILLIFMKKYKDIKSIPIINKIQKVREETINKGNIINFSNTKIIRPGLGLSPKLYKKILGKKTNRKIKLGTPIKLSFIS